jgi:sirohydrochlorin ferrochelatase
METTALLLIAHGSRRPEANADLEHLAQSLRDQGAYAIVQPSYLELGEPGIIAGGAACVASGATCVVLLPYFLSAGRHVVEDLTAARDELARTHPTIEFLLAGPLGRHPLLADIVVQRAREACVNSPRNRPVVPG